QYHADIKTDGQVIYDVVAHLTNKEGAPCTFTVTTLEKYLGTTTGLASVAIKDTVFLADTIAPQTDYRIDVTLPDEKTQRTVTHNVQDQCGTRFPPLDNEVGSFAWDSTKFTLEGHLDDPRTEGRAGSCDKMVKHGDVRTEKVESDRSHPCNRYRNMG